MAANRPSHPASRQAKVCFAIVYRADVMEATIWDQVLARIETKVNRHSFYTWFRPTTLVSDGGGALTIRVPNPLFKDWLTKHYSVVLSEALAEVRRPGAGLVFVSEGSTLRRRRKRFQPRPRRCPSMRLPSRRLASIPGTPSTRSSSDRRISSRTRRAAPSPRRPHVRTTRSSSTAAWDSARRI